MKQKNTNNETQPTTAVELPEGFTPGPWIVDGLAIVGPSPELEICIVRVDDDIKRLEANANAKLIASAPLLLEALKDLESEIGRHLYINNEESFKELLAARDKAKAIINRINQ